jgi:hypothetical protein
MVRTHVPGGSAITSAGPRHSTSASFGAIGGELCDFLALIKLPTQEFNPFLGQSGRFDDKRVVRTHFDQIFGHFMDLFG